MLFLLNVVLWILTIALGSLAWHWLNWWGIVFVAALAAAWCPYIYREATELHWGYDEA